MSNNARIILPKIDRRLFSLMLTVFLALGMSATALAAKAGKAGKAAHPTKDRLVLMPLRVSAENQNMLGAMETALVQGLQQKYEVFAGQEVKQKADAIFHKESAKKDCDETRCMEDIAIAFQSDLIATANVAKIEGGYLLALSIRNVIDNKAVYSNSMPCEGCTPFQVVEKLKELSGAPAAVVAAPLVEEAQGPEMVRIPGKNYEIGKYEVTQKEWRDIMGNNPSSFSSCGDTCPVEQVSWDDIQTFLQKLNQKTGRQYRLPTEAEWEYACYGGSKTEYCGSNDIGSVAWYDGNSGDKTHPVGQKQANGYGLYDMSGNVWEWMENKYDNEHVWRALRGGSWYVSPQFVRAADRYYIEPANRNSYLGFRLARTLP